MTDEYSYPEENPHYFCKTLICNYYYRVETLTWPYVTVHVKFYHLKYNIVNIELNFFSFTISLFLDDRVTILGLLLMEPLSRESVSKGDHPLRLWRIHVFVIDIRVLSATHDPSADFAFQNVTSHSLDRPRSSWSPPPSFLTCILQDPHPALPVFRPFHRSYRGDRQPP